MIGLQVHPETVISCLIDGAEALSKLPSKLYRPQSRVPSPEGALPTLHLARDVLIQPLSIGLFIYLAEPAWNASTYFIHSASEHTVVDQIRAFGTPIHTPQRSIHYPAVFCWTSVESYLRTISVSVDRKFSHVKELWLTMDYPFLCANRTSKSWPIPKYPKCVKFCEHFNLKYTNYHINSSLSMKLNLSTSKFN